VTKNLPSGTRPHGKNNKSLKKLFLILKKITIKTKPNKVKLSEGGFKLVGPCGVSASQESTKPFLMF
jgi:hypothetical protein